MPPTTAQMLTSRRNRQQRFDVRVEWFGQRVRNGLNLGMRQRLRLSAQLLRDKVVLNISRPVTKTRVRTASGTRTAVTNRSVAGEFPKADTTRLMKDVFYEVDGMRAIVGTTLDYGFILETSRRLNRSFLVRTLREMQGPLAVVMAGPLPPFPGANE